MVKFAESNLLNMYDFPWQSLEVVLGEKAIHELRGLNLNTPQAATSFMQACGMNPLLASHAKQCDSFFLEAIRFIRHSLFTQEEKKLLDCPKEILSSEDPRYLLLYASDKQPRNRFLRHWSCAILKVVQAICALEFSDKLPLVPEAREQIFARIRALVVSFQGSETSTLQENTWDSPILQSNATPFQGGVSSSKSLFLEKIEWKESKTRQSILMKLLHKPEIMMEEVFDFLGVRFVVHKDSDIPKLLEMLIENNVVMPHMVMGSRSRNSLLKTARAQSLVNEVKTWHSMGILSATEHESMLRNIPWVDNNSYEQKKKQNVYSSGQYKSLQFTMRYLVRTPNPAFALTTSLAEQLSDLRSGISHSKSSQFREEKLSERVLGKNLAETHLFVKNIVPEEIVSYFPFEFQILDKKSYDRSLYGAASHEKYKQMQWEAVRKRVLGGLLTWNTQKLQTQNTNRG